MPRFKEVLGRMLDGLQRPTYGQLGSFASSLVLLAPCAECRDIACRSRAPVAPSFDSPRATRLASRTPCSFLRRSTCRALGLAHAGALARRSQHLRPCLHRSMFDLRPDGPLATPPAELWASYRAGARAGHEASEGLDLPAAFFHELSAWPLGASLEALAFAILALAAVLAGLAWACCARCELASACDGRPAACGRLAGPEASSRPRTRRTQNGLLRELCCAL